MFEPVPAGRPEPVSPEPVAPEPVSPEPERLIALVDLDGTLCDSAAAIRSRLAELRSPTEDPGAEAAAEPPPYILARRRLVMSAAGFWRHLEPLPAGLRLVELLLELGFDTHVFTKGPSHHPSAWAEKFEWCRQHVPALRVIVSEDKSLVHGNVLVEDWPPYIAQWRQRFPNGLVVLPAQPWNAGPIDNAIRYDGGNLAEVRARLGALLPRLRGP